MKKLSALIVIMLILLVLSPFLSTAQNVAEQSGSFLQNLSLGEIIAGAVVIYEAIVRIVPTVQNISLLNSIFGWLKKLSETMNVKKKVS